MCGYSARHFDLNASGIVSVDYDGAGAGGNNRKKEMCIYYIL